MLSRLLQRAGRAQSATAASASASTTRTPITSSSSVLHRSSIRRFADDTTEARTGAGGMTAKELPQADGEVGDFFTFTLSCPHKELFVDSPVRMVAVPGSDGRFAATAGHMPVMCEMQPGVLSLYHERSETSGRQDHYFVSGGYALIHPNGAMEVAAVECVNLTDLDANNIKDGLAKAREKLAKADTEKAKGECEIEVETFEALERAQSGSH